MHKIYSDKNIEIYIEGNNIIIKNVNGDEIEINTFGIKDLSVTVDEEKVYKYDRTK